jgi:hypothetical protein
MTPIDRLVRCSRKRTWPHVLLVFAALAGAARYLAPAVSNAQNAVARAPESQRPVNFVVFLADDQGEGDLGAYGHRVLKRRISTVWPPKECALTVLSLLFRLAVPRGPAF